MRFNTQYNSLGVEGTDAVQLLHYNSTETLKQPYSSTQEAHFKNSEYEQAGGYQLRRFYFRALVGVLGPLVVTGYFVAVWRIYLAPIEPDSPVAFGPPGAKWIFYSWFVVGVIGLNLSLYGMKGVEAPMLMEPAWGVSNGMKLMLHASNNWSGPGGWMKTLKWSWQTRQRGTGLKLPAKLWFILALPSMFVFTAYPLSGLTMEMSEGFLHGKRTAAGPTVIGFGYADFNERLTSEAWNGASLTWQNAIDARVSGQGIVYTPEGYDRSQDTYLSKWPTVLPKNDGIQRIFMTAQAENPIEGNAWGLMLQYNCSIVDKVEDFRILRYRNDTDKQFGYTGLKGYSVNNDTMYIYARNQTTVTLDSWVENIGAVVEYGYEQWPNGTTLERMPPQSQFIKSTACYYNSAENVTGDYPGIDQEKVFEVLLWQHLANISRGGPEAAPQYNFTVDRNITELYGKYNWGLQEESLNTTSKFPPLRMTAIGVQCRASSSVGSADIDGIRSTYSNFVRTDTPVHLQKARCATRFQADIPMYLFPKAGDDWLSKFFTSTAAPPPFYAQQTTDPNDVDNGYGYLVQLKYLQAEQLRQSMLRAYAAYAVQLMYNGGQGYTARDGSHIGHQNPNVTEFISDTVITRGVMPAAIPVVMFVAWALVGSVLGIVYGFRKRWSAVLDGYAMFRFGAELPDDIKRRLTNHSNTLEAEECLALNEVPGLVGDTKPEMWMGRIGLVGKSYAVKEKMYE